MNKEIDCRGLACPAPVLETKKAIEREKPDFIKIIVDNQAARENVSRYLGTQEFEVKVEEEAGDFHVLGYRGEGSSSLSAAAEGPDPDKRKIMVMIATDRMGYGDDTLGTKLLVNFLKTLKEMGDELWRLVFVNNGVKLTIEESEVLPVLKDLADDGVAILVCGTCLDHFNLLERKKVGETTNMLDIVTAMQVADKVINI